MDGIQTPHISTDTLLDYFASSLSETDEIAVLQHLAECAECAVAAQEVGSLDRLLQAWTAERHGALHHEGVSALAIAAARSQVADPSWRSRLEEWARRWNGKAEAAMGFVSTIREGAARVAAMTADSLMRPGSTLSFAPVMQGVAIRGPASTPSSSTLLRAGASNAAQVQVAVHGGESGEVVVRLDRFPVSGPMPLVLLIEMREADEPLVRVAEARPPVAGDYLVAHFDQVQPGAYLVVLEPTRS